MRKRQSEFQVPFRGFRGETDFSKSPLVDLGVRIAVKQLKGIQ